MATCGAPADAARLEDGNLWMLLCDLSYNLVRLRSNSRQIVAGLRLNLPRPCTWTDAYQFSRSSLLVADGSAAIPPQHKCDMLGSADVVY